MRIIDESTPIVTTLTLGCLMAGLLWAAPATDPRPIVTVHDTSADPFLIPRKGDVCGDPFPACWDGTWHLYALNANLTRVHHLTSTDLVHWTEHEPAMVGRGIATGTVVRHQGTYYMFYTDCGPQTIRLVTGDNPWHFDFKQSKLVARADDKVYQLSKMKFRDCYVFCNEEEKRWWMLVEATSENAVAVGLFKSKDLLTWTQHDPIFIDESRGHASCPQVFERSGRWHLTLLDYPTWHYSAKSLHGPWTLRGHYHTKRLTAASRWATDGRRHLGWGFFTAHATPERAKRWRGYGNALGVGREIVMGAGGAIGVRPLPELVAAIREPENNADLFGLAKEHSGKWELDAAQQVFRCTGEKGGVLLLDLPERNPNYYFEAEIELPRPGASATVVARGSKGFDQGYRVALEPAGKKIAIRQFAPDGGVFDEREHEFSGKAALLQVFVCDGQIEAFVDGRSSLSAAGLLRSEGAPAIEITGGPATIRKPLLHYFKHQQDQ